MLSEKEGNADNHHLLSFPQCFFCYKDKSKLELHHSDLPNAKALNLTLMAGREYDRKYLFPRQNRCKLSLH